MNNPKILVALPNDNGISTPPPKTPPALRPGLFLARLQG